MLWQLLTSLPLAQIRKNDDGGGGWARLLPMIVIAVLYVLSSLAKGKQQKEPPAAKPSPTPGPSRTARPLPSYARKISSSQSAPTSSRPTAQSATRQPARPSPISSQQRAAARPAKTTAPWPTPSTTDQPIRITAPTSAPRPAAPRPKPQRPGAQSAQAVARVGATLSTAPTHGKITAALPDSYLDRKKTTSNITTGGSLRIAMGNSQDLARAIVYGEILGPPRALRPFSPYGLPNP